MGSLEKLQILQIFTLLYRGTACEVIWLQDLQIYPNIYKLFSMSYKNVGF